MRSTPIAMLILLTALPAVAFGQRETRTAAAVAAPAPDPCAALLSSEKIRTALATFDGMLSDPPPADMTTVDAQEYRQHSEWLASVRDRLHAHLADRDAAMAARRLSLSEDPRRMAAMNMEFQALQDAVENESRQFQTLSNASKARHDIAMNSIRNMKA